MSKGKALRARLETVFTEYGPRVHSAAEAAESRLAELEQRDRAREQRDAARREELRRSTPALGKD
jgi:hypothetical protein